MSEVATALLDDGRRVAAGLQWSVAPLKEYGLTQARLIAKTAKAPGFLLRAGRRNLALLAPDLPAADTVALGDALCNLLGESWCGVFLLDGKPVFLAAYNGCIQADGDQVYSSEEAARARLLQEAPLYTGNVYAPASWAIDGSLDSGEVFLSVDWSSATPFEPVKTSTTAIRSKAPLLIGVLVLVGAFAGFELYQARMVAAERAASSKKPAPPVDPWRMKVRPEIAAAACDMARHDLAGVTREGWEVVTLTCDFAARTATATLAGYTTQTVVPRLDGRYSAQMTPDGSGLVITAPLSVMTRDRRDERPTPQVALAAHNYLFAHAGEKPPTWQAASGRAQFEATTAQPIWAFAQDIGRFPTTSINRLEYREGAWLVQGEIYD